MSDNRTTELESLSKLKTAGRLHYWRGTIEIPESELHAICDEIQAEYDRAVAAMNKAAGNWAKSEAEAIAAWNSRADYHGYEKAAIEAWESIKAWNSRAERTCEPKWTLQGKTQTQEFWRCECGNCGYEFGVEDRRTFPFEITIDEVDVPNFCPECGAKQKVVGE